MKWQPTAELNALRQRAAALARLRAFFAARGVLEVETPLIGAANTDPNLPSFGVTDADGQPAGWLQTSPEFHMKRLLAAGSGPIWQLSRAFRAGEVGRWHNPEFSLVEWYRPGWDLPALMDEVADLARQLSGQQLTSTTLTYAEALSRHAGLDLDHADAATCAACLRQHGIDPPAAELDRDAWLDLVISCVVAPQLGQHGFCFLTAYPPSQAALARIDDGVAQRFELYWQGVELANGFAELTDAAEQRQRFVDDNTRRRAAGQAELPLDEAFLAALEAGLPESAGVALGLDRLLMLAGGHDRLAEVIAFAAGLEAPAP